MYSPRISEDLIPSLYRMAKAERVHMTELVDRLLVKAIASESLPGEAREVLPVRIPLPRNAAPAKSPEDSAAA
ncbi:MAG: hypothetical protein K1Y02_06210 [Candidatus Hydrogenedentes bacterium]|nr:hypothetical protein [Candidatus Hydrogenedentota bacterium]